MSSRNSAVDKSRRWLAGETSPPSSITQILGPKRCRARSPVCAMKLARLLRAVMLNPCYVALASANLQNSGVKVGAVVGFPLGARSPA